MPRMSDHGRQSRQSTQRSRRSQRKPGICAFCALNLAALGAGCLLVAGLLPSASIERALLGEYTGALRWGPTLFRVLLAFHGLAVLTATVIFARREAAERAYASPSPSPEPGDAGNGRALATWVGLPLLAVVALGLRLWQLDTCLWYDETLTLVDFLRRPIREVIATFPSQNQHMLYSIAGSLSVGLLGDNPIGARLPAVLFGVASILAVFVLGRRVAGAREAWLAAILMTVSYHHVWFSQNARGYTGLLLFATLSSWLWLEAQERGSLRWWAWYVAAVCLGIWVHFTMLFVVAAHGMIYLGAFLTPSPADVARGNRWKPVVAWMFAATCSLQLLSLSFPEFLGLALHESAEDSDWQRPLWLVQEGLRQLSAGGLMTVAALIGAAVMACGVISFLSQSPRIAVLLTFPAGICAVAILALRLNLWPRFFFFSIGFFLLILVRGLMVTGGLAASVVKESSLGSRVGRSLGVALCSLVILASAWTVPRVYAYPKQDFTGARDFVEQQRRPGDAVVAVGLAGVVYKRYFAPEWAVPTRLSELDDIRQRHASVWLVFTLPIHLQAWQPDIWQVVQRDFEVVKVFRGTLGGGDVNVCQLRPLVAQESSAVSRPDRVSDPLNEKAR